ncbi:MAG: helix-turn-helix domain-containing protein [Fusicatenibacter sp.]|nr:AraC family transcriptional regulator [Fusicatenibacter sp.]
MIEILNGMHETINYGDSLGLRLYHNVDYEDYPDHWHVGMELIMPIEKGYVVIVGKERYELEEGDIILMNSGVIHALEAPPTGERIILQFDTALLYTLKEMETLLFMMPAVFFYRKDPQDELYCFLKEKLDRIIREYDGNSAFREASIYAALIEIFVELGRREIYQSGQGKQAQSMKQQEYLEAVMNACNYINRHYMDNLTLEEVANVSGFSKFHFTRIFKQYMNMTFYEYLNSKRVKRAEELLYNKEMSITDVAMNSGFSSLSAFNRTFKTIKNCSPSDYRKQGKP